MTVIADTHIDLTGVRNVMDGMRGCTSTEAREYLAAWKPSHKPAYLTGYPKTRRLARKLTATAYTGGQQAPVNPHLNVGLGPLPITGRPATTYPNLVPLRIKQLMHTTLQDRMIDGLLVEDDAPEVDGLPVWLDDIISGALVWNDSKSTAHKLSPFWMRKVIMLPVISTASIMELTGLKKRAATYYMKNGILACRFILRELDKKEMAELGLSAIVGKGDDQSESPLPARAIDHLLPVVTLKGRDYRPVIQNGVVIGWLLSRVSGWQMTSARCTSRLRT